MKETLNKIPTPAYVLEEKLLERNLELIKSVREEAGVEIILAFKGFAMWGAFDLVRPYINAVTASSVNECQLAFEEMKCMSHTYCVAYDADEFDSILKYSSHITFNSLNQYNAFAERVKNYERPISIGLRVNHGFSEVETALYNPCAPGSRLGIPAAQLDTLPEGIEGLHFHSLCESNSFDLEKALKVFEEQFSAYFPQLKWVNFGGGHLMTHQDYDVQHLIQVLKEFRKRHPNLKVILEPGSAFAWETGSLYAKVLDIVENHGVRTAILNVSFAAHMPDCLEMPYQPTIRNAYKKDGYAHKYRIGGNSCLAGDYMDYWTFEQPLKIGDTIIFEDMIHYTMVKTTFFNGVKHPSIGILDKEGNFRLIKDFTYQDFRNRLS